MRVNLKNKIKYGHYGNTTQLLISKALEFPDGEEKDALIRVIANIMKKDYVAFNNRGSVENEVIQHQMDVLSGGKLKIKNPDALMTVNEINRVIGSGGGGGKSKNKFKNKPNKRKKK